MCCLGCRPALDPDQVDDMKETERAPINWVSTLMFIGTSIPVVFILPFYLWFNDVSGSAWLWGLVLLAANGLSITAGYHRLWSHRAYKANDAVKWFFAIFGGMAVQNSILYWSTGHRNHHRHVDHVDNDPYSAKRGFWFSHMGWMVRDYPASQNLDFSRVPDLLEDKVVMTQHNHYLWFAFGPNIVIPVGLGLAYGDLWGFVLVAGFLRLVLSHHFTFFINSLAHMWGRRPYTTSNTARDNDFLAFFTWGEGYHNYHHIFQYDYRNGIRWWQWDPTKWLIAGMAKLGLARDLKRVPEIKIQQARVTRELERMTEALEKRPQHSRMLELREQVDAEWAHFKQTVAAWAELQSAKFDAAREQIRSQWENSEIKTRIDSLQIEEALREQLARVQMMQRQLAAA